MSHNKCYYCESLLKGTIKEIDHFIEVSERKALAFEWTNLFLSCENCNNKMSNLSISVDDALNPCIDTDDEIEKHISFEDEQITFLTDKGDNTIKKFRLSTERLDYLRMRPLQIFTQELIQILQMMNQDGRKKMNETEKKSLKRFAKADNNYSLMFAKYLKAIKGARIELFFKHYNLYKNPRLKIKSSLAPFSTNRNNIFYV
jgi:uncharacterized protein (TIGR02646 family)